MRIALDAMGGDHGPAPNVAGAVQAVAAAPDVEVVLVGDQSRLEAQLGSTSRERIEIVHASQTVDMHDSPVDALRKKPDNSIARCWQLMAEKKVDALVGAGSTGAMVAAGLRTRKFLPRVRRPEANPVRAEIEELVDRQPERVAHQVRAWMNEE